MILLTARRAPERHDAVADILVDGAVLGLDAARDQREMRVQHVGDFARVLVLRQGREARDVGEHHGDGAAARREAVGLRRVHQAFDQAPGHVGLEPPQRADHAVERLRRLTQLGDGGFRRLGDVVELETADLVGGQRQGRDRLAHRLGDPPQQEQRQREDGAAGDQDGQETLKQHVGPGRARDHADGPGQRRDGRELCGDHHVFDLVDDDEGRTQAVEILQQVRVFMLSVDVGGQDAVAEFLRRRRGIHRRVDAKRAMLVVGDDVLGGVQEEGPDLLGRQVLEEGVQLLGGDPAGDQAEDLPILADRVAGEHQGVTDIVGPDRIAPADAVDPGDLVEPLLRDPEIRPASPRHQIVATDPDRAAVAQDDRGPADLRHRRHGQADPVEIGRAEVEMLVRDHLGDGARMDLGGAEMRRGPRDDHVHQIGDLFAEQVDRVAAGGEKPGRQDDDQRHGDERADAAEKQPGDRNAARPEERFFPLKQHAEVHTAPGRPGPAPTTRLMTMTAGFI